MCLCSTVSNHSLRTFSRCSIRSSLHVSSAWRTADARCNGNGTASVGKTQAPAQGWHLSNEAYIARRVDASHNVHEGVQRLEKVALVLVDEARDLERGRKEERQEREATKKKLSTFPVFSSENC